MERDRDNGRIQGNNVFQTQPESYVSELHIMVKPDKIPVRGGGRDGNKIPPPHILMWGGTNDNWWVMGGRVQVPVGCSPW